jgi:DNA-binding NarL/FixJ family response regulator
MTRETANKGAPRERATVLIVSDQPVLRYGLTSLLSQEPSIEACEEAEDVPEALQKVATLRPELAAISLPLQNRSHPGLIAQLKTKHPPLKVLAAVRYDDPSVIGRVLRAGADGCIHWGEPVANVVEAVRTVLHGDLYMGSSVAKRLLSRLVREESPDHDGVESLSDREWHILMMIGQGLTTQQIAGKLDLSPRTVESHRKKIKLKAGLQNATQLSHYAYQAWHELMDGSQHGRHMP